MVLRTEKHIHLSFHLISVFEPSLLTFSQITYTVGNLNLTHGLGMTYAHNCTHQDTPYLFTNNYLMDLSFLQYVDPTNICNSHIMKEMIHMLDT